MACCESCRWWDLVGDAKVSRSEDDPRALLPPDTHRCTRAAPLHPLYGSMEKNYQKEEEGRRVWVDGTFDSFCICEDVFLLTHKSFGCVLHEPGVR